MSIHYNNQRKIFTLTTRSTTYQMRISDLGHLIHLYYGRKIEGTMEYLCVPRDCGFSPNPYQLRVERSWSMDLLPQEYSGSNTGDFRLSSLNLITDNGIRGVDLYYVRHEIRTGKYAIPAMPAAFDRDGEAETLSVTLKDPVTGLEAELLYGVYEQQDVITRAVHLTNTGTCTIHLEKVASLCLDIPFGKWDMLHFVGRHTMERQMERIPLMNGIQTVASRRGTSSHQHNPFVILCDKSATEDSGDCYGIMLVYSGNHRTDVEVDQSGSVRVVSGIHDEQFSWKLESGESFDTPEALLTFTHQGFTPLSQNYHRFLKKNICRSKYTYARDRCLSTTGRLPILILTVIKFCKLPVRLKSWVWKCWCWMTDGLESGMMITVDWVIGLSTNPSFLMVWSRLLRRLTIWALNLVSG